MSLTPEGLRERVLLADIAVNLVAAHGKATLVRTMRGCTESCECGVCKLVTGLDALLALADTVSGGGR